MSRVIVHVERLVLRGFAPEQRERIAAGLQQELAHVFSDREVVPRWKATGDAPNIKVGGVWIAHRSAPRRVGEAVGQGIGKEMRK